MVERVTGEVLEKDIVKMIHDVHRVGLGDWVKTEDGWRVAPRRRVVVAGPAIHERVYLLRYVAERDSPGAPRRRVGEVPQEGAEGLVDVG